MTFVSTLRQRNEEPFQFINRPDEQHEIIKEGSCRQKIVDEITQAVLHEWA